MIQFSVKLVEDFIDKQTVAFISSVDELGFPNTKAVLAPRIRLGLKEFYFISNTPAMRTAQYRNNPNACLYFYNRRFFQGVMLTGTMEVLEDMASKVRIWREGDTKLYKEGVSDPNYCVLKFNAQKGRFYHNFISDDFDC